MSKMSFSLMPVTILLVTLLYTRGVESFSRGAPSSACDFLAPSPTAHRGPAQNSTVPYSIDLSPFGTEGNLTYTPGSTYTLTIAGNSGEQFRGVLIQARLVADDTSQVGSFSVVDEANSKLSDCTPADAGITHSNAENKTSFSFRWTAPPEGTGAVRFGFSVVEVRSMYWANERSDPMIAEGDSGAIKLTGVSFLIILMVALAVVLKGMF